jgi:ABC-type Mn2+/Zn2+ transport system permease subunit
MEKKFWQSSGFWTTVILLFATGYTSFTTEIGNQIAGGIIAIFAFGAAAYRLVKDGKFDFKKWRNSQNVWNYLATLVAMLFGEGFVNLIPALQELVQAIGEKNLPAIFAALFSLGTLIFYLVTGKKDSKPVEQTA